MQQVRGDHFGPQHEKNIKKRTQRVGIDLDVNTMRTHQVFFFDFWGGYFTQFYFCLELKTSHFFHGFWGPKVGIDMNPAI